MTNKDTLSETLRYLGRGPSQDQDIIDLAKDCLDEIRRVSNPKCAYHRFSIRKAENGVIDIDAVQLESEKLLRNLSGCGSLYLFAATLGVEADMAIRSYQRRGQMSRAVVLDAAATALIEEFCDSICEVLRSQHPTMHLRPRFSPGYGDLALKYHADILRLTDAQKKIGLTLTDSFLLLPQKSVTAVIGLSSEKCTAVSGCKTCSKADCIYRRK